MGRREPDFQFATLGTAGGLEIIRRAKHYGSGCRLEPVDAKRTSRVDVGFGYRLLAGLLQDVVRCGLCIKGQPPPALRRFPLRVKGIFLCMVFDCPFAFWALSAIFYETVL